MAGQVPEVRPPKNWRARPVSIDRIARSVPVRELLGSIPREVVVLDGLPLHVNSKLVIHANIEEPNIAGAVRLLGPYLKHLHGSENDHRLLGRGHVDFPAIIAALGQIGYDGYLVIEGFGYSPSEKNSPGTLWADLSVSPEEIASTGALYLKSIMAARNLSEV